MAQEKITQTAGRVQLGEFAPDFARYNDDVLFGEVWNSPGLCPHDRSLVTIATLVGKGIIDSSLSHHLEGDTGGDIRNAYPHRILCRLA